MCGVCGVHEVAKEVATIQALCFINMLECRLMYDLLARTLVDENKRRRGCKVQLRLLPPSNLFLIVNSETVSVATLTGHWDPNGTPH